MLSRPHPGSSGRSRWPHVRHAPPSASHLKSRYRAAAAQRAAASVGGRSPYSWGQLPSAGLLAYWDSSPAPPLSSPAAVPASPEAAQPVGEATRRPHLLVCHPVRNTPLSPPGSFSAIPTFLHRRRVSGASVPRRSGRPATAQAARGLRHPGFPQLRGPQRLPSSRWWFLLSWQEQENKKW